jgi:hypothetical protein
MNGRAIASRIARLQTRDRASATVRASTVILAENDSKITV